jgi:hypothetical protein
MKLRRILLQQHYYPLSRLFMAEKKALKKHKRVVIQRSRYLILALRLKPAFRESTG